MILKKDGKVLLIAFDHAVEHGPARYEGIDLNPKRIVQIAAKGADGVILHAGAVRYVEKIPRNLALIVKITARTNLSPIMTEEVVTTVEEAASIGADAIGYTVYVGSSWEPEMLKNLSSVKLACRKKGLPILGFMYPRVNDKKTTDVKAVRYAARLGAEIGVDIVKTYYTGSRGSFSKVVNDCFIPVVAAGGPKISDKNFLKMAKDVMASGAAGLAVGRNVWSSRRPVEILKKLRKIVHG